MPSPTPTERAISAVPRLATLLVMAQRFMAEEYQDLLQHAGIPGCAGHQPLAPVAGGAGAQDVPSARERAAAAGGLPEPGAEAGPCPQDPHRAPTNNGMPLNEGRSHVPQGIKSMPDSVPSLWQLCADVAKQVGEVAHAGACGSSTPRCRQWQRQTGPSESCAAPPPRPHSASAPNARAPLALACLCIHTPCLTVPPADLLLLVGALAELWLCSNDACMCCDAPINCIEPAHTPEGLRRPHSHGGPVCWALQALTLHASRGHARQDG